MIAALAKAVEAQKPDTGSGAKSWWRWPLLIILVLVGVLVAAWALNRDRRELARLRHARNKARIEEDNATAETKAALSEATVEAALTKVIRSKVLVANLDKQIAQGEAAHAKRLADIKKITWGDLPRADTDLPRADTERDE